jgi:hypothetical protein
MCLGYLLLIGFDPLTDLSASPTIIARTGRGRASTGRRRERPGRDHRPGDGGYPVGGGFSAGGLTNTSGAA